MASASIPRHEEKKLIHCLGRRIVMNGLIGIAIFLLIAWLVLRVAFALTGLAFHLLWIAAVVLFVLWVIGKISGAK
jgi:Fe2+ transport system protein B